MLIHHFGAEAQGFQRLVNQNDLGKSKLSQQCVCTKPNQNYRLKQPTPGSVVSLAMFTEHFILS